jgi:uncharacterized membrane protein YphA (DoxX/SURF4 family)
MNKLKTIYIWVLSLYLGGFFIYKGFKKHLLGACKVFEPESTIPLEYQNVITALCHSGFTLMVGVLQVTTGLLIILPKTKFLGSVLLLPIISNIFLLHFFLDNRPEELIETGIPLIVNILIIAFYFPQWKKSIIV